LVVEKLNLQTDFLNNNNNSEHEIKLCYMGIGIIVQTASPCRGTTKKK